MAWVSSLLGAVGNARPSLGELQPGLSYAEAYGVFGPAAQNAQAAQTESVFQGTKAANEVPGAVLSLVPDLSGGGKKMNKTWDVIIGILLAFAALYFFTK